MTSRARKLFDEVYFLSYATPFFEHLRSELLESCRKFGMENFLTWSESTLRAHPFYHDQQFIFSQQRGAGFWLWKPFLILRSLQALNEEEVLFYADAGCRIIDDPTPLIKIAKKSENGVLVFDAQPETNRGWTKRDAYVLADCDNEAGWNSKKVIATVLLFRKCATSIAFVTEWLNLCLQPQALTDAPNMYGDNLPEFKDHRHDQALLGLLVHKHKMETFRNPSPWGNFLKLSRFRVKGEHISYPYLFNNSVSAYSTKPQANSPYHTIFEFNRRDPNHYLRQPLHGWAAFKMRLGYIKRDMMNVAAFLFRKRAL